MTRIRLSPAANVRPTEAGVYLSSDLGTVRLHGEDLGVFATRIVPLLDGTRSREEVAAALDGYSDESVLEFLSLLERRGLLEAISDAPGDEAIGPQERFVQNLAAGFLDRLRQARILVFGLEPWGVNAAIELAASGVGGLVLVDDREVCEDDLLSVRQWSGGEIGLPRTEALRAILRSRYPGCDVRICALKFDADDELALDVAPCDLLLTGLNADEHYLLYKASIFAQRGELPSLHGHLDGLEAWIGPALVPGKSACWNCFRLRRLGNVENTQASHDIEVSLLEERPPARARAMLAPMAPLVGQMLAMEALRLLGLVNDPGLPGTLRVHNLITSDSTTHKVVPMPWCNVCGGAAELTEGADDADAVQAAGPGPKFFPLDSVADGAELRALLEGWIDERVGVIRSLTATPTGQSGVVPQTATALTAVYTTGHVHGEPQPLIGSGKALTSLGAEIGALGEAIERYSASRYRHSDLLYAAIDELQGDALSPGSLALYSPLQYARENFPCAPWDPARSIHWTAGNWFGDGGSVWVPALPTYFNFMTPWPERFCQVSSNGLAAGGDNRDAALRAVLELLERDAFMLAWLCRLPARRLVLDADIGPDLNKVMQQFEQRGVEIELWLLDDLGTGIPTVVSIAFGDGSDSAGTSLGLGCHPDIRVAASKALLEEAHFGPYLDRIMKTSRIPETPEEVVGLEDHALYYVPVSRRGAFDFLRDSDAEPVLYSSAPGMAPPDGVDLYDHTARRLREAGLRVAIVDVTSPDVRLSPFRVARAVGEHIQPIHFGWSMRPLANERLQSLLAGRDANPDPHPVA